MLSVLIADADMQIGVHLSNVINATANIRCIAILNDGNNVCQRLRELKPDVLILDLDIIGKRGVEILEEIQNDNNIKTKVFILLEDAEDIVQIKNYKCIAKVFYKSTQTEEIVRELENMVLETSSKNIENETISILFKLGFTYSLKGTKLINDCIIYSIKENEDNIKNIYMEVAKKKGENANTIKSNVNTAINNMWRYTDQEKTRKILRLGKYDKPSSKNIIEMVKYYITN